MHTVAVVQARTGSQRLPGKVLMDLDGRPLIERVLTRAASAASVDEVVLATTDRDEDDALVEIADGLGLRWHRGSEHDVLARFRGAAREAGADAVVRITGDCPLVDPEVIDAVAGELTSDAVCDLASNVLRRTFPKGLDAEALYADVLERAHRMGTSPEAREHVTWFVYRERPELFVLRSVEHSADRSALDWSVDTAEDLEHVRALWARHDLSHRRPPWTELADSD